MRDKLGYSQSDYIKLRPHLDGPYKRAACDLKISSFDMSMPSVSQLATMAAQMYKEGDDPETLASAAFRLWQESDWFLKKADGFYIA